MRLNLDHIIDNFHKKYYDNDKNKHQYFIIIFNKYILWLNLPNYFVIFFLYFIEDGLKYNSKVFSFNLYLFLAYLIIS